ncbi:MAG: hypothetical protein E6K53_00965, partial [Gammaproteobacteria bacterium]
MITLIAAILVFNERQTRGFLGANPALAIVDFTNLSQDRQHDWIAPVLGEELAAELAMGGSVHTLPGELVHPAQAGLPAPTTGGYARDSLAMLRKRLDADYVLSGSYLVSGTGADSSLRL